MMVCNTEKSDLETYDVQLYSRSWSNQHIYSILKPGYTLQLYFSVQIIKNTPTAQPLSSSFQVFCHNVFLQHVVYLLPPCLKASNSSSEQNCVACQCLVFIPWCPRLNLNLNQPVMSLWCRNVPYSTFHSTYCHASTLLEQFHSLWNDARNYLFNF